MALTFRATLDCFLGNFGSARTLGDQAVQYCQEQGHPFWISAAMAASGESLAKMGEVEEGIGRLRQGIAMTQAIGSRVIEPLYRGQLTEALLRAGQSQEALQESGEAIRQSEEQGVGMSLLDLRRIRGLALLAAGTPWRSGGRRARNDCRVTLGLLQVHRITGGHGSGGADGRCRSTERGLRRVSRRYERGAGAIKRARNSGEDVSMPMKPSQYTPIPYVDYGGTQMLRPPYVAENVSFYAFLVEADIGAMQRLLDNRLNFPSGSEEQFEPAGPFAIIAFNKLQKMYSLNPPDRDKGWVRRTGMRGVDARD